MRVIRHILEKCTLLNESNFKKLVLQPLKFDQSHIYSLMDADINIFKGYGLKKYGWIYKQI